MELSKDQLMQFAKVVNEDTKPVKNGITVEGTAVLYGGKIYVRLDGSDQLTPVISSTAGMKDGDRVTVMIKDHSATVTGNVSSPSAGKQDVDDAKTEIGNKITELEVVIADKVSVKEFDAEKARIDSLTADNVVIKDKLTATDAEIKDLKATNVTINGQLTANKAEIDDLKVNKLDASVADLKFATIENLNATNADIHNLNVDYGEFKKLTAGDIQAHEAEIQKLTTEKLSATEADLKYANIDFANIGEAAIKKLFSDSGIIKDLVVSQGHITGELVGVTIKGDLIEGGTVKADKLVVKGTDGLYYKLNTDGEKVSAQQTEYNSLNGSIITAKSVTAEKVNVDDLVAFGATIGGFHIDNHALYSGVKSSIDNTTRGTFMNDDGEFAIGDQSNYLKFYRDTDGTYKLAISAKEIKMSSTNVSIETIVGQVQNDVNDLKAEAIKTTQEQFYPSTSPTELVGGYWSSTQPTWTDGIYLWRRTLVTYVSGDTAYTPSLKGVCITGNTGEAGSTGVGIASIADRFYLSDSNVELKGGSWVTVRPDWVQGKYIWTRYLITYTDGSTEQTYPVCVTGPTGNSGTGVSDVDVVYAKSSSNTEPPTRGWQTTTPPWEDGKYIWSKTITKYTNNQSVESAPVCITGSKGQTGAAGANGKPGADGNGIKSTEVTYQASASQTSAPTGSWSTSVPKLSTAIPYLWTKTVITYTDGKTSTSYSVSSTLDGVEVGGRNLVLKSNIGGEAHNPDVYNCARYAMSIYRLEVDGVYTVQINATTTADRKSIGLFMNNGNMSLTPWLKTNEGTHTYTSTFVFSKSQADALTNSTLQVFSSNVLNENQYDVPITGTCDVHWIKLERGNKATDWTPAPEDIQQNIDNAQNSANDANNKVDNITETVTKTSAELKVLSDSISSLVTDAKGQSLMTQTGSGWTFNIGSIQSALNGAIGDIQDVKGDIEGVNELANKTNQLANDVAAKTAYINMTQDDSGQPVMELGQQNGEFKLRITNTSMDFMQGSQKIAYLSNRQLYIQSSVVTDEMKIGATSGYIWKKRGNGNMGLRYVSS